MNDDTGEGYRREFVKKFTALGGNVVLEESYSPDATDYRSQLAKIKAATPAVLFVPATSRSLATVLNQAKELAIGVPVISNFGVEGNDLLTLARENAEGVLYTSIHLDSAVADAYRGKHGKELNVVSALCYDALMAISEAVDAVGTDDPGRIGKYLEDTKGISGATGRFSFDSSHDTVRRMIVKTVRKGRFVVKDE
jgi:branched-chain amino acid transport system substrate-binding protein